MRVQQPPPYPHAPVQAPQTTQEKPISEYPPPLKNTHQTGYNRR